jgi:hypothetical protein
MLLKSSRNRKGLQTTKLINSKINFSVSNLKFVSSKNIKLTQDVDILLLHLSARYSFEFGGQISTKLNTRGLH